MWKKLRGLQTTKSSFLCIFVTSFALIYNLSDPAWQNKMKKSMAFIFYTFLIRQVFATFYDLIFRAFKRKPRFLYFAFKKKKEENHEEEDDQVLKLKLPVENWEKFLVMLDHNDEWRWWWSRSSLSSLKTQDLAHLDLSCSHDWLAGTGLQIVNFGVVPRWISAWKKTTTATLFSSSSDAWAAADHDGFQIYSFSTKSRMQFHFLM